MQAVNSSLSQRTATASKDLSIASSDKMPNNFAGGNIPFGYPTVAVKAYQDGSDGGDQSLILLRKRSSSSSDRMRWVMSHMTAVKHLFPSTSQVDKEISSGTSVPCLVRPGSFTACQLGRCRSPVARKRFNPVACCARGSARHDGGYRAADQLAASIAEHSSAARLNSMIVPMLSTLIIASAAAVRIWRNFSSL